jgi:hypothetical protein
MYASTDLDWFLKNNRKMSFDPGTKSEYMSVDTQMLGMIIKKVTNMKVADYFSKMFGNQLVQSIQQLGMLIVSVELKKPSAVLTPPLLITQRLVC